MAKPVKPTSALAQRIAHDIAEQIKHDGDVWEAWMADYIEQEAMQELADACKGLIQTLKCYATGGDVSGLLAVQDAEAALTKAGLQ